MVLLAGGTFTAPTARGGEFDRPHHPRRMMVQFQPGATAATRHQTLAAVEGAQIIWESRLTPGLRGVQVPHGQVQAAVLTYRANPNVLLARPSYYVTALGFPNDPEFDKLWALHNTGQTVNDVAGAYDADVDAPQAWDIWQGSPQCLVAVLDTGVDYKHPDLYLNTWINQGEIPPAIYAELTDVDSDGIISFVDLNDPINQGAGKITDLNANGYIDGGDLLRLVTDGGWADGADNDGNGYIDDLVGWDAFGGALGPDRDPNPTGFAGGGDDPAHGTQVAGVVAAVGNNNEGVVGVARGCKIVAIKAADENGRLVEDAFVPALEYLIANVVTYNIRVSVHAWGVVWKTTCLDQEFYDKLYQRFEALHVTGQHIAVAAAGNVEPGCFSNSNNDDVPVFPANFGVTRDYAFPSLHVDGLDSVLSVTGTTSDDDFGLGLFHYGANTVHLGAPGVTIYSPWFHGSRIYEYTADSGTSFAAPHVAGAVALLWSRFPDWTMQEVRDRVLATARPLAPLDDKTITGAMVNAYRAVHYDCNANGLDDAIDISGGTSSDCTAYETNCCVEHDNAGCGDPPDPPCGCEEPDITACVCDFFPYCCDPQSTWDSNCVGVAELCFPDACPRTPDTLPDECQPSEDCQGNTIPDPCDLACGSAGGPCDPAVYPACGQSADCNDNCIPDECEISTEFGGLCDPDAPPAYVGTCRPDCQLNTVPDECDVAAGGASCDIDANGVPDECAACCHEVDFSPVCTETTAANCATLNEGTFFPQLSCDLCSCSEFACCHGDTCSVEPGCECAASGGYALGPPNVFPSVSSCFDPPGPCDPLTTDGCAPCELGACCDGAGGSCRDSDQGGRLFATSCIGNEFFVGGAQCSHPQPCGEGVPAFCPGAAFDPAADVDPPDFTVDAREPHPYTDNSFEARRGIGSPNTYTGGPEPVTVTLNPPVECAGHFRCWEFCETGIEDTDPEYPVPTLDPNRFESITETSPGVYEILLDRPISGGHYSAVTYLGDAAESSTVTYASLPANANGDNIAYHNSAACSGASDAYYWSDCCFSFRCGAGHPVHGDYSCDINRDGTWNVTDVSRIADILQGRETWITWECVELPTNPCEGGGEALASGGTETSMTTTSADSSDRFFEFVTTAMVPPGRTAGELRELILVLTDLEADTLPRKKRQELIDKLESPDATFTTRWVEGMVPLIVNRLSQ